MTKLDFLCLLPLLVVASAPIIMMLTITIARNFKVVYVFSLLMFVAAIASLFFTVPYIPYRIEPLLILDGFSILFLGTVFGVSFLITIISYLYLKNHTGEREEYFIILFIATLGASVLVMANHFVTFFLGLETLSISLYVLIAYLKYRDYSIEAGVKFLVIASVATAFLLFGMALIYAATGEMSFAGVAAAFEEGGLSPVLLAGFAMMLTGIGFKLALVPFHMWTPDIYQGAPAPVSTFIATVSKGAILAVFIRFFTQIDGSQNSVLIVLISVVAILSMFTGNLIALKQSNFKRLLAYSSIAHMGYLMITLLTGTVYGVQAAIFYLISYMVTTLGTFGTISILSVCERDAEDIDDLKGLFWKNPRIAVVLSLCLLSLAGIPLTAGFIAKFYLVLEGVRAGFWILAFSLVINSVISLFYYLRVIKTMFTKSDSERYFGLPPAGGIVLAIVLIGILFLGILPTYLTEFINSFLSL
jgi:NADH-quinone oxidoreductase subunit N